MMRTGIGMLALALVLLVSNTATAQNTQQPTQYQSYSSTNTTSSSWMSGLLTPNWGLSNLFSNTQISNSPSVNYAEVPPTTNVNAYLKSFGYQRPWRR